MKARPILFLIASLCSSFILNDADRSVDGIRFERSYNISRLTFNVPGGELRSMLHCGALCARSSSCKAFCYSQSTALCHLSQPYDPIVQEYDVSDSKCYNPHGCPMTKGYAWYGARCIKGFTEKKNHTDARAICTQDGGHLYHFKDLEWDVQPIEDLQAVESNLGWFWVGAGDLQTEGQFLWSDSTPVASDLWDANQPDDARSAEDCVELRPNRGLNDDGCSKVKKFVCQIDV